MTLLLVIFSLVFFHQFIFQGLLPIPSDIIVGAYYPWLINPPTGIAVHNPLPSDVVSLTYPLRYLAITYLKSGILPLWNPHILAGVPLLANFQAAVFYPLNLLYFLSDNFPLIWSLQVFSQSLLAAFFMHLFLRSNSLTKTASLFGSLVWGLGGFHSLWAQYNTVFHAILYLPLVLWSVKRLIKRPLFGVFISLGIAASLTVGNPPMSLILLFGTAFYSFFEYGRDVRKYLSLFFFAALGIGLALPQILPGLEAAQNSIRDYDQVAAGSGIKFLPLHKLITLATPDFFGSPTTYNLWSIAGLYDNLTIYFGVIPLAIFLTGIYGLLRKNRLYLFSLILFILSLALMVENPFSRFIGNLDILGLSAMVMTRFSALTNFALAVGATVVLNELLQKKISPRQFAKPLLLLMAMIIVPLMVILLVSWIIAPTASFVPNEFFPPPIRSFTTTLGVSFRNSLLPLTQVIGVLFFILLAGKVSLSRKPVLLALLFFTLTFLDLFRFFTKYNSFTPRSYLYPENKIIQFLKKEETRFVTSRDPLLPANMWLVDSLNSVNGQDTLHSLYYNQFISLINFADLNRVTDRFVQIKNFDSPLLDFLNVKYILALKWKEGRPDTAGKPNYPLDDPIKFPVVFADGLTAVIERKNPFPPVFSVDRYELASDIKEEQKFLEDSDLSQTVLLNQAPGIQGSLTKAQISRISQKGNEIAFETKSAGNSLIVLSTAFYPGWQYYLDGAKQEDPPLRANHAFLAILVPPGEHTIHLVYLPASYKLALALAATSFIALILFLFSHIIRSNHEQAIP